VYPDIEAHQTLHPYFDNVEEETWLKAQVVQGVPASFLFQVDPPTNWSALTRRRLERHLETFDLQTLYISNASSHLAETRHSLHWLFQTGGSSAVRAHLQREAMSREQARLNSWSSAMYRAAAMNDWFCEGGYPVAVCHLQWLVLHPTLVVNPDCLCDGLSRASLDNWKCAHDIAEWLA